MHAAIKSTRRGSIQPKELSSNVLDFEWRGCQSIKSTLAQSYFKPCDEWRIT